MPDAEIWWPSTDTCPYPGQVWAVEVELTAKSLGRTTAIMGGLLSGPARYAQVLYLTAAPARPVVTRAAAVSRQASRPGSSSGPAPGRVHARGGGVMTVWTLARFTITLWLLRKAVKVAGGCYSACWPCAVAAHHRDDRQLTAAWLRGWPPARLRRAAATTLTAARI